MSGLRFGPVAKQIADREGFQAGQARDVGGIGQLRMAGTIIVFGDDALTFREEYELTTRGNTALEGATFLSQERASFDRISNDVARTVVTAILEAF